MDRQHFHRVVLDHLRQPVLACDPAGGVLYMNPAAERLTGWPLWEAVNRPLAALLGEDWQGPPLEQLVHLPEPLLGQCCAFRARWGEGLERHLDAVPLFEGLHRSGTALIFAPAANEPPAGSA
jgi:PAS domain-containing protein